MLGDFNKLFIIYNFYLKENGEYAFHPSRYDKCKCHSLDTEGPLTSPDVQLNEAFMEDDDSTKPEPNHYKWRAKMIPDLPFFFRKERCARCIVRHKTILGLQK